MSKINSESLVSGSIIHPGEVIRDELKARGMKQKAVAAWMGIAPNVLSELIHGKRNVTADLALKLEKALDIPAMFWMNFQAKFEIDRIRRAESIGVGT